MHPREKATPQDIAREILAQIPKGSPVITRTRKDGTSYELDPAIAAQNTAARMGDCGRFLRGKVVLTWKSGEKMALGSHQCNGRLCPTCARRRGNRLAGDMAGALALIDAWGWTHERTRFATLTIENTASAESGITRVMDAWHRTLATKTWGRMIAGGFRAVEVKPGKNNLWNVHLHAIIFLWTPGIPYKLIRDAWDKAAGGHYNQRFDALRNKARAHPGESKASAAARYLVKYLVKHDEIKGTRTMPGGLPHMIAALLGRRLFGAWGLGAAALRIERHERPGWTGQFDRHLMGYRLRDQPPESAVIETPWGRVEKVPIPLPPLPQAFREDEIADQIEPTGKRWTIRKIHTPSPLAVHPWRKLPTATAQTAQGMRSALEIWIENPKSRGPKPFRWRRWLKDAPKEWTPAASLLMGSHTQSPRLGAMLWTHIQPPNEGFPSPDRWEHIRHQLEQAHAEGITTARRGLAKACTPAERSSYLARMPESIRHHLEETCQREPAELWAIR